MPDEYEYWNSHRETADEWGIDLDTLDDESDTHFGSPKLPEIASGFQQQDAELTDTTDLSELLIRRHAAIKEYETIAVAVALDSLKWNEDGPTYLSEDGQTTLDRLVQILSAQDLEYCLAKGNIEMHKQFAVHQCAHLVFAQSDSR